MIKSFRDKETELVYLRRFSKRLPQDIQRKAKMKLSLIDAADDLDSLRVPPGNRLEALSGVRAGQHSIRINDQWRICFTWSDGAAWDVEITDYH
jgi:proteic killer suppression protein